MAANEWLKRKFKLTTLEESFCRHYIATRCNASEAYTRASPKEIKRITARCKGYKLLQRDEIRARVSELMQKYLAEIDLSALDVVQGLARVATTTVKDIASWNKEGVLTVVPSDELGLREAAAIRSIRYSTRKIPQKDNDPIVEVKLDLILNDQLKAWELLGKYFSIFVEKKLVSEKDLDVKLKRAIKRAEKKNLAKVVRLVQPGSEIKA